LRSKILVAGASGAGTSTPGRALAADLAAAFVDADDLYWLPTDPPFKQKRDPIERAAMLREALAAPRDVVVAGSILGWGAELEDSFDLIVFLRAPAALRVRRLRKRELRRRRRVNEEFIAWAAQYDIGAQEGRSLARHLAWLKERRCPVLTLSGVEPVAALAAAIRNTLKVVSRLV
jgi:adenylate kinase family enzyme